MSGLLKADSHIALPPTVRADFAAFVAANAASADKLQRAAAVYGISNAE
jgi:hypothetical protein